jgi:hypothetical protein
MNRRLLRAALLGVALLLSLAGVVSAKEGAEAALDAPIPPGAEPGTEIEVGWRAGWPDGAGGMESIIGSPVFIRLTSVDGSEKVEVGGTENPPGSGHYVATITMPRGGVGLVEIGLRGESCVNGECSRSDIPFALSDEDRLPQLGAAAFPEPTAGDGVPIALAIVALGVLGPLAITLLRARRTTSVPALPLAGGHVEARQG